MSAPLNVEVAVPEGEPDGALLAALAASPGRVGYRIASGGSVGSLQRRWRASAPDVVLVVGRHTTALIAAWLAGARVAWLPLSGERLPPVLSRIPHGTLKGAVELEARLAEVAARPGAGVTPERSVTVVTTVLNEGATVDDLLQALIPQLGPDDELVVVDGGSADDTADRVRRTAAQDDRIRLIVLAGASISAGRNAGVAAARHSVVCCTDAGCSPSPTWLHAMKAAYSEMQPPALVTGVYEVVAETPIERALAASGYPRVEEARRPGPLVRLYGALFGRTFDARLPTGRSLAFQSDAWETAGGFREDLATGEDVTFGRAIAAAGGRCVLNVDASVAWHQRPSLAQTAGMYFRYGLGGAASGDRLVVGRDLARAAAIVTVPALLASGRPAVRRLALAGLAAYLSLPLARALRDPAPALVVPLTLGGVAVKDAAKAAGCLVGLLRRRSAANELRDSP